jgi:hypothetical protein
MRAIWSFISNTFLILAGMSLKRFYKFTYLFFERLEAQQATAGIGDIYNDYKPFYLAFKSDYIKIKSKKGVRIGDTYAQKLFFIKLYSEKMPPWVRAISDFYEPKSPEYKKIFPQGLTPLSTYPLDERLAYFDAMIETMKLYSNLNTIRGEMETFRDSLEGMRDTREHSGSDVDVVSDELHGLATDLAIETYSALGSLMKLYRKTPEKILAFMSISLLHYYSKTAGEPDNVFELLFAANETKEAGFVFTIDEKLMIYNSGNTTLRFWFAKAAADPMSTTYFDVEPDAVKEYIINVYANADDHFLMVKNLSTTEEGSVEIEKVD